MLGNDVDPHVVAGEQERAGASELAGALAGRLVGGFLCCRMAECVPGKGRSGLLSSRLCQELPQAAPQGFIGAIFFACILFTGAFFLFTEAS